MVAISFSVFKDDILSGKKTQTIRRFKPKRYEQLISKRKVQLYWHQRSKDSEFMGEYELDEVFPILSYTDLDGEYKVAIGEWDGKQIVPVRDLTEEELEDLAHRDGFVSFQAMREWFLIKYGDEVDSGVFMVIRWKYTENGCVLCVE